MVSRKVAVLRADASSSIGVGHVMRCVSLGEALAAEGFGVELVSFDLTPSLQSLASSCGIEVVELPCAPRTREDAQFVEQRKANVVVVDGYEFTREFFSVLEESNIAFAVVDDNAETKAFLPSVVINQNPHASTFMYEHMQNSPKLLLGLQYAMIRKEVRDIASMIMPTHEGEVFVAMGGADFLGLTSPIVVALANAGLQVKVAVGHANSQRAHVQALAEQYGQVTLIEQSEYVSSLASAHVAVLAAGSSLWEACAVGTPSVGLIVADNQLASANAAQKLGFTNVVDCRLSFNVDKVLREVQECILGGTSAMRGAALSVGISEGANRVANSICQLSLDSGATMVKASSGWRVTLRRLREEDIDERFAAWFQNRELMQYYRGNPAPMSKQDLLEEFAEIETNGEVFIYAILAVETNLVIGTIRIGPVHRTHRTSDLVVLIGDMNYHGKGLAVEAISQGNNLAFAEHNVRKLHGGMYASNAASIGAYLKAGWVIEGNLKDHYLVEGKPMDRVLVACFPSDD